MSDGLEFKEDYAHFRPTGEFGPSSIVVPLRPAMQACLERGVRKILIDFTQLVHGPMSVMDRFDLGEGIAKFWDRSITIAVLARPDQLDPKRFAKVVAANRGLQVEVFTEEAEAIRGLQGKA